MLNKKPPKISIPHHLRLLYVVFISIDEFKAHTEGGIRERERVGERESVCHFLFALVINGR